MNGISQDLFICVNTVLSKSTFLFKLLALVPLIKLDHFTVKDAIFFDNQQIGRYHLSECIRLDITFNCFKSAYCGEWLFKFRYTTQTNFFQNLPIQSPLFFSSAARRWSVLGLSPPSSQSLCMGSIFQPRPKGSFPSQTSLQRKERRETLGTRLSLFSCFVQSLTGMKAFTNVVLKVSLLGGDL